MARKRISLRVVASYISLAVTFVTVAALFLGAAAVRGAGQKAWQVKSVRVAIGDYESKVTLDGVLGFEGQYPGVTALAGRVAEVYVAAGDAVKKDQALFKLDTSGAELLLQRAYQEAENAKASGLESGDAVVAALIQRADAGLENQIFEIRKQIELSTVRAGRDGFVTEVMTSVGGYLAAGGVGAVLSGTGQEVTAAALQKDAAQLKRGMRARLYIDGVMAGTGQVLSVGTLARDEQSGLFVSRITIVPDEPLNMNIGAKVKAEIITQAQSGVALVPAEALDSQDRVWQIYEGRAFPVSDVVRFSNDTQAWLQGVAEGTQVIYLPDEQLQAGQRVKEMGK